jgi:hypothetical protein
VFFFIGRPAGDSGNNAPSRSTPSRTPKAHSGAGVVGFPFELNGPLAFQPGFLVATERIVVDALCK